MLIRSICLAMLVYCGGHRAVGEEIVVESVLISVIDSAAVPARDAGVLDKITTRVGAQVAAGDLLVQLDISDVELAVERANREFEIADREYRNELRTEFALKSLEVAAAELKRAEAANKKFSETVSRTEVDRLRLITEKADLDVQQSQHEHRILGLKAKLKAIELRTAQQELERRFIRAPIDGTVIKVNYQVGEWVQPGMAIVELINTSTLRGEAVLPSRYRHLKLDGCPVRVAIPVVAGSQQESVSGVIDFVNPQIDSVDGTFRVQARLDNQRQLLRPGDSVTMRIMVDEPRPAEPVSDSPADDEPR